MKDDTHIKIYSTSLGLIKYKLKSQGINTQYLSDCLNDFITNGDSSVK